MNIFLCEPNIPVRASRFEPLGLCSISAYLKSKGHLVRLYQQFDQPDRLVAEQALSFEADIVGFSCIDVNLPGALRIAKMIKDKKPSALVVFGGEHPTANPHIVTNSAIDLVVVGEGEITLFEVATAMEEGKTDFSKIDGLVYFDGEKSVHTGKRDRIADLGSLPLPDRDILGRGQYQYFGLTPSDIGIAPGKLRVASSHLSRGCTFNCRFCTTPNVWGRKWIARPVDDVIRELHQLADAGINFVYFQDENFLTNLDIARQFCEAKISRGPDISFSVISRVAHIDEQIAELLARAGLKHIGVGIESVREETLGEIHKGLDLTITREKIAMLQSRGISVCGLFMIGYPWETEQMILGYSKAIADLGVDTIKIQFLTPFAGTAMYEEAKEKNQILSDDPLSHSTENPVLKSDHLSAEQLLSLRKRLYRKFYFSPRFVLKIIRQAVANPSLIPVFASRLFWFLKK